MPFPLYLCTIYLHFKNSNHMKKTMILLTAVLLTLPAALHAQTNEGQRQQLVVWLANGQKVYHDLTDEPVTTFDEDALYLNSATTTISYPLSQVLRYTYTGIEGVPTSVVRPGEIRFAQGNDQMTFDGLPDGMRINVYSPDGKLLQTLTAHNGQTTLISLVGQPAGTYIIQAGDATYKFLKR